MVHTLQPMFFFSSDNLNFVDHGLEKTRVEKTLTIADWKAAQANLQVCCWLDDERMQNCGKCSKCVRTLTTLELSGKRSLFKTFPNTYTIKQILKTPFIHEGSRKYLADISELAAEKGRSDIVNNIKKTLRKSYILFLIKKNIMDNKTGRKVLGSALAQKIYFMLVS